MAVNTSRNMREELEQGLRDGKYIHLSPDWGVNTNPPLDRMSWPTYRQAERHDECGCYNDISPREPAPSGGVFTVPKINPAL